MTIIQWMNPIRPMLRVRAEEKLVLGLYASIPSQVSRIRTYHLVVSRCNSWLQGSERIVISTSACFSPSCVSTLSPGCCHWSTYRVGYHHEYWKGRSAGGMWPAKCAYIGSDNLAAMAHLPRLADRALTDFWRSYYTWMCSGDLISWSFWEISSVPLKDSGPAIVLL